MKRLYVEWVDPYSIDEWHKGSDQEYKVHRVCTLGWLVEEKADGTIVLALNLCKEDGDRSCVIVLPKEVIKKKRILK